VVIFPLQITLRVKHAMYGYIMQACTILWYILNYVKRFENKWCHTDTGEWHYKCEHP